MYNYLPNQQQISQKSEFLDIQINKTDIWNIEDLK